MSEITAQQAVEAQAETKTFQPITTQDELNKLLETRVMRERAKYAGFEEFKAKAAAFDELEAKTKAEISAANERAASAEAALSVMQQEAQRREWNAQVAEETGIPVATVADFGAESIEELREKAVRAAQYLASKPVIPVDRRDRMVNQSVSPAAARDQFAQFAGNLFR